MNKFIHTAKLVYQQTKQLLSITKWARMITTDSIDLNEQLSPQWINHLARAAAYEKRHDRENHLSLMWEHLFA